MTLLTTLKKIALDSMKRVGRGYGSGRGGHTSGRGTKGDKARGDVKLTFDGSKIKKSWIQRTPRLRGKNRLKTYQKDSQAISLTQLDSWFTKGATVDYKALSKKTGQKQVVFKIVGTGKLTKKLNIKGIAMTESASKIING